MDTNLLNVDLFCSKSVQPNLVIRPSVFDADGNHNSQDPMSTGMLQESYCSPSGQASSSACKDVLVHVAALVSLHPNLALVQDANTTINQAPQHSFSSIGTTTLMLPFLKSLTTGKVHPTAVLVIKWVTVEAQKQWLIGSNTLVTPILTPGAMTVNGIFPGCSSIIWCNWYTHTAMNTMSGGNTTLDAPISRINIHIQDSTILLLHQEPGYTIYETHEGPYLPLVSLNADDLSREHLGTAIEMLIETTTT
ncbi:hypothetical protein BDR06DRAFT_973288 [Suillus hirtellus]|nr:hypothetical protein BDR06DRAFT_973288 [Suillus hirtellus]